MVRFLNIGLSDLASINLATLLEQLASTLDKFDGMFEILPMPNK
ncbi:hypothetical protein [Vibrio scophthalmi]|nr:hypothetical protein [Vibrio scophthalmi]